MKFAATTIAFSLCWAGCSVAEPAQPQRIAAGTSVSLRTGESAQTGDGAVRLGFVGVSADSRCGKGEQCVWAGDAVVRVWLQRGSGAREMRELHTAANAAPAKGARDQELRLVRLDPAPIAGKAIAQRDYVVTLSLGAAVDPER